MEKEEEVDRRRGKKSISKRGKGWTLSAQLEQLKTGQDIERGCCEVICGAPTIMQGLGIN